jgi:hypothetical protein
MTPESTRAPTSIDAIDWFCSAVSRPDRYQPTSAREPRQLQFSARFKF